MPYNPYGDLYKSEVVYELNERGCNIKSVRALNLIMEEMGLQEHYANGWMPTDEGMEYTPYIDKVLNAEVWHASLVDAVYDYLDSKGEI